MLRDIKLDVETKFHDNWTSTTIHYGGEEFPKNGTPVPDEWINLTINPLRVHKRGISIHESNAADVQLYVVCWADNDVKCNILADNVISFMDEQFITLTADAQVIDHGWNDTGKVFMVLQFNYVYVKCTKPPAPPVDPCFHSVGGADGMAYNINEPWLPNCIIFKG